MTLDEYSRWAAKEAQIANAFKKRLSIVEDEINLMKKFLKDFYESTGETLKENSTADWNELGKIVGSNLILNHRMTSRYAETIPQVWKLVSSEEYLEKLVISLLNDTQQRKEKTIENETFLLNVAPEKEDFELSMASFFHIQRVMGRERV